MTPIDTLRRVRAALPVLQTMLTKAGLLQGATIASEHLADLDAAIAALSAPEASGADYVVRKGADGEWGIFARSFNVRLATFARGSDVDRDAIAKLLANPAPPTSGLMKCVCTQEGAGCTNKCDRGQIPALPAATYRVTDGKLQQVATPADESGAECPFYSGGVD